MEAPFAASSKPENKCEGSSFGADFYTMLVFGAAKKYRAGTVPSAGQFSCFIWYPFPITSGEDN